MFFVKSEYTVLHLKGYGYNAGWNPVLFDLHFLN